MGLGRGLIITLVWQRRIAAAASHSNSGAEVYKFRAVDMGSLESNLEYIICICRRRRPRPTRTRARARARII